MGLQICKLLSCTTQESAAYSSSGFLLMGQGFFILATEVMVGES
jgi:hypothetical protein